MQNDNIKDIYYRIFRNSFYFWFYFLFVVLSILYIFTLEFNIEFFGVPATHQFVYLDFRGLNTYFNLGWVIGVILCGYFFFAGVVSSIMIKRKIWKYSEFNMSPSRMHILHSLLMITAIWIIFFQISWLNLYNKTVKEIKNM